MDVSFSTCGLVGGAIHSGNLHCILTFQCLPQLLPCWSQTLTAHMQKNPSVLSYWNSLQPRLDPGRQKEREKLEEKNSSNFPLSYQHCNWKETIFQISNKPRCMLIVTTWCEQRWTKVTYQWPHQGAKNLINHKVSFSFTWTITHANLICQGWTTKNHGISRKSAKRADHSVHVNRLIPVLKMLKKVAALL